MIVAVANEPFEALLLVYTSYRSAAAGRLQDYVSQATFLF